MVWREQWLLILVLYEQGAEVGGWVVILKVVLKLKVLMLWTTGEMLMLRQDEAVLTDITVPMD